MITLNVTRLLLNHRKCVEKPEWQQKDGEKQTWRIFICFNSLTPIDELHKSLWFQIYLSLASTWKQISDFIFQSRNKFRCQGVNPEQIVKYFKTLKQAQPVAAL